MIRHRRLIPLAAALFLLDIVAGAVLVYRSSSGGKDNPWGVGSQPTPVSGVKIERYKGLSICVQAVPGDAEVEAVAKASIEAALLSMMKHEYWKLSHLDRAPPVIDIGCPSEPLVARPGVKWIGSQHHAEGDIDQYNVAAASFYHIFVFVMSPEQIHSLLGGLSVRLAPQEYLREGDVVHLETTAIYVSREELGDASFLTKQLTFAVGFESPFP